MGMYSKNILTWVLAGIISLAASLSSCVQNTITQTHAPVPVNETRSAGKDLSILQSFSGDYPVAGLLRLPSGQEKQRTGYIGSPAEFAMVWQVMFPSRPMPDIDFTKDMVIFTRNMDFYNRTIIGRVVLKDGVVEVLAAETMSSLPIEDKVAMALAVVPSEGVSFIRTDTDMIPVRKGASNDPLDAVYRIEGHDVRLFHGHAEAAAVPGSAVKGTTSVFGSPAYGNLNNDGIDDAALILVCEPGGSGTFYYVAAALKVNGAFRGTNAVLLGDRIAPGDVLIRNGIVVVTYTQQGAADAMTAPPNPPATRYLRVNQGNLEEIGPLR